MNAEWLEILACPWCVTQPGDPPDGTSKGQLKPIGPAEAPESLRCLQCGRTYKIEEGIPNMLIEDAILPNDAKRPGA
jgi:uncharacterized protein YbaR (Trm112 family)